MVVGLLSLNFGIVFFDRNSTNFLMPFVQKDLGLSYDQVGSVAGIFSFFWAIAAFGVGRLSDIVGNRKLLLVISTLAFSACSFLTGLASTFAMLIGARILKGVAEGGVMPVSHAMVASEVSPERRGLAQGIAQNLGSNFFGSFVAPVVLTWLAAQYGWRNAFYIAGIPGIISGLLIWFLIEEPAKTPEEKIVKHKKGFIAGVGEWLGAIREVIQIRNIWVCVVMGVLLVAYLVITWAFMPLYLTQVRGLYRQRAKLADGCARPFGDFGQLPHRRSLRQDRPPPGDDRHAAHLDAAAARRHVLSRLLCGDGRDLHRRLGAQRHLPAVHGDGAVRERQSRPAATVFGLCMGSCEILGGALGPKIAGMLADSHGLQAPLWMMFGLALAGGLVGLFLKETAPSQVGKRKR